MFFNAGWVRAECVCVLVWGCGGAVAGSGAQRGGGSHLLNAFGCLEREAEHGEASWEALD